MTVGLTEREAYLAMFAFLEERYSTTRSEELGGLLGGMTFLKDGGTVDPAAWADWCRAVKKAVSGNVNANFELK
jgi:hypothetical protein